MQTEDPSCEGVTFARMEAARERIAGIADDTPLVPSALSAGLGQDLLLKLESAQPTGAFKIRGALAAVGALPDVTSGVVCCSTGNHGRAIAYAARARGFRAVICMSRLVPEVKVAGIRALGAEVRIIGDSQDAAQIEADRLAREDGLAKIPPFDHPDVIAGQATIGQELVAARPDLDLILVPLSGGGLAAGAALAAKAASPGVRVIGVSMDRGAAMHASLQAGYPVDVIEVASLADSLGGGIGSSNRYTFRLCRDLLDDVILVSESEIYRAMQAIYFEDRLVCEGASAVGVAALISGKLSLVGPTATILTGRNLDMATHAAIMRGESVTLGNSRIEGMPYAA